MNEVISELKIEDMIYEVRGKQVMLDRDLAYLYRVETRTLNQKVKRNIERFPDSFCFQMTDEEFTIWKSQIVMSDNDKIGLRRPPYVFTEQGVAMLSAVINSDVAINVSVKIMDAFVSMRRYLSSNLSDYNYITKLVLKHETQIDELFSYFESKYPKNDIYLQGEVYDAYSKILDILLLAKESLIIIDSYADKYVLDMISKVNVPVTIVLSTKSRLSELDVNKYKQEYNNLTLIYNDTFHDRFIILDNKILYNLGTSINNAGTKTFIINRIEDIRILNIILEIIKEHI